jgi:hypothetical protein
VGTVAEASAGSGVVFKALWQTQFSLSLGDRAVDQCTSCRIHISRLLEFRGRPAHRSCSVFAWRDPKRSRAGRSSISPPRAGACLDAPDLAAVAIFIDSNAARALIQINTAPLSKAIFATRVRDGPRHVADRCMSGACPHWTMSMIDRPMCLPAIPQAAAQ